MANYIYGAVSLTGGGTGSLDSLNGIDLHQADAAIVFTSTATYIYTLDENNSGIEDIPELIIPDQNPGNKRWKLVSSRAAESSCDFSAFNGILNSSHDDVQKALSTIDDMFDTGDFVIAPGSVELSPTVVKSIGTGTGTATPSNNIFNILGTGKIKTVGSGPNVTVSVDDLKIATKTSSYTILPVDDIVVADCAGGNVELTLPQASTKSSVSIIKKSNSNKLTIRCYGSETIEGRTFVEILDEYGTLRLVSDGTNTWITSAQMYDLPIADEYEFGAIKVGDNLKMVSGELTTDFSALNIDIIPDEDNIRSLGSPTKQWKDVYVGPGSFYVNGQEVISDNGGTIVLSADTDQNVQIKTGGGGDIEFYPSGSGAIEFKGSVSIQAGKNILSNDGNPISFASGIDLNNNRISELGEPINGSDAATRSFASNASNLTTGTLPAGLLPEGYLKINSNLSDLNSPATAKVNIGLSNVPNINCTNASNITTGTLPTSVLPQIAITTTQVAANQTAMLALTTQQGDVVVRTDLSRSYIHNGGSAGTMADFTELSTPIDAVLSVNTKTGAVVLNQDDVADGTTYKRSTAAFTTSLNTKLNGIAAGAQVNPTAAAIKTSYESNANTNAFTDGHLQKLWDIEYAATADQTDLEIKIAYENNTNTNAFTDALQTKLNGINTSLYLAKANNLSDITNASVARTNLGLENVSNIDTTNASNITSGTLPSSVLPPLAITKTQVANSQIAMLALTTEEGDIVIRTDLNRSYIRNAGVTGTITDFNELLTPTDSVLSVNTKTGTIVLNQDDIGDGTTYKRSTVSFTTALNTKLTGIETGATADQTASEIKTLYETNSDTNAFTDAFQTKLTGIDTSLYLQKADNLAALPNKTTARSNLGLGNVPNINCTNASNITTGTLPSSVLPPLAITSTYVANSQIAMLALTTQEGDIVVRTDEAKSYIKGSGTAGTMADFIELASIGQAVSSVNSKTGTVILTQDDIASGATYKRTTNDYTDVEVAKLQSIENGATADQTAAEILALIKTVDGSGSGLDANLLNGKDSSEPTVGDTIVLRNPDGDINARYVECSFVHETGGQGRRDNDTVFFTSYDGYIRKNTDVGIKNSLGLGNVPNIAAATGATGNTLVQRDVNGDFSAVNITANLIGNASTATTATTCSGNASTSTTSTNVTVATTTDSLSYVGLWENATGSQGPKTDGGLTYNANTNELSCTGKIYAAQALVGASGAVGFTINDGYGNANIVFNHTYGIPDVNGNSGRIVTNVDIIGTPTMTFQLAGNVSAGVAQSCTTIMTMKEDGLYASNFIGNLTGKLNTPRTISLSGDATGSIGFDGSANVTIPVVIANDSHSHTISTLPIIDEDTMVTNSATLLPSQQSVKAYVDTKVADVVNSAPAALDTLNELATALGNDPNFATSVSNSIGMKADKTITIYTGSGLTGGGTLASNITIDHEVGSGQQNINNPQRTYIQSISLDPYGHIVSMSSGTETVEDTNTWRDVHDTPTNSMFDVSISSNWAYQHENTGAALGVHGSTSAATPITLVERDGSGDIYARQLNCELLNFTESQENRTLDTVFYSSMDNSIRKTTASGMKTALGLENVANVAATSVNTGNTIVLRDGSGDFSAGVITATVTTARFADLAEKYTCSNINLPIGTVVTACKKGSFEVEQCNEDSSISVVGVISGAAAYIMNNDLEHSVLVGLTGKLPTKIIGTILKGSVIVAAENGCARQLKDKAEMVFKIGVALESNDSEEEKLVLCAIK